MAIQTMTISNTLSVFGPAPTIYGSTLTSGYNVGIWATATAAVTNESLWGEGSVDHVVAVYKVISNTQSLADLYSKQGRKKLPNTLTVTEDLTSERVGDGSGYWKEFTNPSDNAEDRVFTSWASGTAGTPSFTSGTAIGTTWS